MMGVRTYLIVIALAVCVLPAAGASAPPVEVIRDLVYASPGGVPLRLDAYLPPGAEPHPAVIFVHGGGWTRGSKNNGFARLVIPLLSDAGYAAFSIEYRLAPQHPYPAPVDDVRSAIRFIRANAARFRVADGRVALAGASAGGHLVSLAGTTPCDGPIGHEPSACGVRTVVSFFGPADLRGWAGVGPVRAFLGPRLDRDSARVLAEASPITHVTRDDPPHLLLHGDRDAMVPHTQSVAFFGALQEAGVPSRLVTLPGGDHGTNWATITAVDWRGEFVRWLETYLKAGR